MLDKNVRQGLDIMHSPDEAAGCCPASEGFGIRIGLTSSDLEAFLVLFGVLSAGGSCLTSNSIKTT